MTQKLLARLHRAKRAKRAAAPYSPRWRAAGLVIARLTERIRRGQRGGS